MKKDLATMAKTCRNFQLKLRRTQLRGNELKMENKELSHLLKVRERKSRLFGGGGGQQQQGGLYNWKSAGFVFGALAVTGLVWSRLM